MIIVSYTKFPEVVLNETLSWKKHLKYNEKKLAKSIGLMQKAKTFLEKDSVLSRYFSHIHSYINKPTWHGRVHMKRI